MSGEDRRGSGGPRRRALSRTTNFHASIADSLKNSDDSDSLDEAERVASFNSSGKSIESVASLPPGYRSDEDEDYMTVDAKDKAGDTFHTAGGVHSEQKPAAATRPGRPVLTRKASPSLRDLYETVAPPSTGSSIRQRVSFAPQPPSSLSGSTSSASTAVVPTSRAATSRVSFAPTYEQDDESTTDEEELEEALDKMNSSLKDFAPTEISLDRKSMRGSIRYISPAVQFPAQDEESAILLEVAQAFELGIEVKTTVVLAQKIETFIGSDAVDWLLTAEFASSRGEAEDIGKRLMKDLNLFEHVPAGVPFFDDLRYYRFTDIQDRTYPEGYEVPISKLKGDKSESTGTLEDTATLFKNGVKTKNHKHRNMTFHKCFIGADAVNWMIFSSLANSKRDAVHLGQKLSKDLGLFKHIRPEDEDEQDFKDDHLFFRFVEDEKELSPDQRLPVPSYGSGEGEEDDLPVMNFGLSLKVASAVSKFKKAAKRNLEKKGLSEEEREALLKYLGFRLRHWGASFHQTDPRRQILDYITGVKQIRHERVIANENRRSLIRTLSKRGFPVNPRLQSTARASLFAIFRPTSTDAIRKMMTGEAVGKGLDIKGKSAKRGKLSAFVPFLQISENHHKTKIKTLSTTDTLRIFYSTAVARDSVASVLEQVCEDMMLSVATAKSMIQSIPDSSTGGDMTGEFNWEEVQNALAYEMDNPTIRDIDDYAPHCYGIEVPVRLFWEAYIVQQDISRPKGSQYDGGRPSIPAFQDKNIGSLCSPPIDGNPRAVLWQYADLDTDTAMNPFELLMAYEEHNRVFPVVSDFDAFLVGSQRISFHQPLPSDQIDVLKWSVNRIRDILANPGPESWTSRWLEVIENPWEGEDIHPVMPRFGFGDPASYSIMEKAANTLASGEIRNGAVRHGAECFNYYFPQDLDDEFLVISDSLPEHWKYMDPKGVQDFLSEKIKEGYTFPLNPKWILCDGWGHLYDELFQSDRAEAKESLDTWFPRESGVREQIAEIRKNHPEGFVRKLRRKTLKGVDPSVLADIISCQNSTNLDGESTAAGVSPLLASLKSSDEQEISRTTSTLAAMSTSGTGANVVAKELGKSIPLLLRCLDEFLMNATIQMDILSIFETLVDADIEALVDTGLGPALLNHLCRLMMVHSTHERLVGFPCRILIGILPKVSDDILRNVSTDLFQAVLPMLDQHLDDLDVQTVGLNMLLVLCKQQKPYQVQFVNCNGCELIVKSMKHQIDSHDVQSYGCSIFYMLSQRSGGGQVIGERGAIEAVVNAMTRHPESILLQNDVLVTIKSMARVSKNRAAVRDAGAEDAILYSTWINVSDAQVAAHAFDALSNIVMDNRSGVSSAMRELTLSILIVAMKRHLDDENLQRSALGLLQTYATLPDNVRAMQKVYEQDLMLLCFSAATNCPDTCASVSQSLMATIEKAAY